ncbi:capsular polysaccharide synthesis protein [Bifidobacterium avesanii]|uniref:Polysaccharide biosynthesis protein n=1 Tax=Bifidobacterium avesanii TaxID=1798157 RepID=A0A7K3TI11_9BIFI|nr:capsular polysaccharide synthesis protein [Bifidobacterium avesanii]KAB8288229.1 polysaccharide biosynthesis protein [Bifidobacterium avesanii]NEG78735.1 polysaccharide biosynthesis protein [Bifidobacterium avesanii]
MVAGHSSIKRIVHRVGEELRSTGEIARLTSWPEALGTFRAKADIQVMNRNGFREPPAVRDRLVRKHETLMKYFEKRYGAFCDAYDYEAPMPPSDPSLEGKVWVCWWQGLDSAPLIVRRCVESIRRNAGGREVVVVTDENYGRYVHIPEWVKAKQKDGIITKTNLSDLLRLSLLAEHGGLWLDSTFFCTGPLEGMVFSRPLWSIKRPDYLHCSIAQGYFAGYSLACDVEHRWIFRAIRDFFLEYWRTNDFMVDYLMVDYMIVLAQRHCRGIADAFAGIVPNNPRCDDLYKVLGDPFDEHAWDELHRDTSLFKLTWKQTFSEYKNDIPTFYHQLITQQLSD